MSHSTPYDAARIGSVEVVEFIRETGGRIMPGRAEALSKKILGPRGNTAMAATATRAILKMDQSILDGLNTLVREDTFSDVFDGYIGFVFDPSRTQHLLMIRLFDFYRRNQEQIGFIDSARNLFMEILQTYPLPEAEVRFISTVRLAGAMNIHPGLSETNLTGSPKPLSARAPLRIAAFLWMGFFANWYYRTIQQSVYGFGISPLYPPNQRNSLKAYFPQFTEEMASQKIYVSDVLRKIELNLGNCRISESLVDRLGTEECLTLLVKMRFDLSKMIIDVRKIGKKRNRITTYDKMSDIGIARPKKDEAALLRFLILSDFGKRDLLGLMQMATDNIDVLEHFHRVFSQKPLPMRVSQDDEDSRLIKEEIRQLLNEFIMPVPNSYRYNETGSLNSEETSAQARQLHEE
ncbi:MULTISPECIES: hypothetical protein [Acetobacter]|uniref:Uncharacterized protein n=2 Tax=Acetobacter TaxID=434 RepID=A0AAN1PG63_9PROT|nr:MULTISPECIES: hypothetical protein [Acetobacter]ASL41130.1 hypothetical protein CBI36_12505 [Acetobacter oryzifermentans]AXM99546.1 hypothetical protein CJF59_02415 [Acetobacter pomorum]KAA8391370.1 hypothetical protein FKW22_14840 [Acetobacter sp. DmW_125124]KAA8394158.1 hypothetical protein FKW20_13955 [Acetobacter sp. DmW_125127]KAA8399831.1 hypothetical protein FKW19_02790 [Acetobacter sp. DmW_125128]